MTQRANAALRLKEERERDQRNSRRVTIGVGIFALLLGVFLMVDPTFTHTTPYGDLTEATIEIKRVDHCKYDGSYTYTVKDSHGATYVVVGNKAWDMDLTEILLPGDRVEIKYQPAYYRHRHHIQELRKNGDVLVIYHQNDRYGMVSILVGGLLVVVSCCLLVRVVLHNYTHSGFRES